MPVRRRCHQRHTLYRPRHRQRGDGGQTFPIASSQDHTEPVVEASLPSIKRAEAGSCSETRIGWKTEGQTRKKPSNHGSHTRDASSSSLTERKQINAGEMESSPRGSLPLRQPPDPAAPGRKRLTARANERRLAHNHTALVNSHTETQLQRLDLNGGEFYTRVAPAD